MPSPRQKKERNRKGITTTYNFPADIGSENAAQQHYMIINSYDQTVVPGQGGDGMKPLQDMSVALYIPADALRTSYTQKYETFEGYEALMTGGSKMIADAMDNKATSAPSFNMQDTLMSAIGGVKSEEWQEAAGTEMARSVAQFTADKSDIAKGSMVAAGLAINPFLTVYYSGPGDFRTHTFSFDFLARNQKESESINNIVRGFRSRMLPGRFTSQLHSYFLQHPHQFDIDFFINGKQQTDSKSSWVFTIKRSVITQMNVDFAGQGVPVFFNDTGAPFNVKMDLTFQELEILTRQTFDSTFRATDMEQQHLHPHQQSRYHQSDTDFGHSTVRNVRGAASRTPTTIAQERSGNFRNVG